MGDELPIKFLEATEGSTVSFDFIDISQGVGYVTLNCGDTGLDAGLSAENMNNGSWYSYLGTSGAAATLDLDFDMPLNKPLTIKGDVIVSAQVCMERGNTGSGTNTGTLTANLYSVDSDSNETLIVSGGTALGVTVGQNTLKFIMKSVSMTAPLTTVKAGDTLRLNLIATDTTGGVQATHLVYDPKGRDVDIFALHGAGTPDGTRVNTTSVLLPLRIDL